MNNIFKDFIKIRFIFQFTIENHVYICVDLFNEGHLFEINLLTI